ncbi:MAG TPA: inositol monophosphatase family protein, partial [Chloroflexota bacterium]|nr:inositol monophosphatase family protein [Chloroflexota bacterium]
MLDLAVAAARAAGAVAMRYFEAELQIDTKADRTPVTQADREAEALIRRMISERYPDHRFLGEEMGGQAAAGAVWIIDPIDGTKNFIRGLPFFAVQLALHHNGVPVLGVSYAPVLDELLAAERGKGATYNGSTVHVSHVGGLAEAFVSHGGLDVFDKQGSASALLDLSRRVMSIRGHGDFYGYHLLARGKVDVMLEAQISPWDIAALRVIVTEAGGRFTDLDGASPELPASSLATNGLLHEEIVALLAGPKLRS